MYKIFEKFCNIVRHVNLVLETPTGSMILSKFLYLNENVHQNNEAIDRSIDMADDMR